jgi:hypothetical protein
MPDARRGPLRVAPSLARFRFYHVARSGDAERAGAVQSR